MRIQIKKWGNSASIRIPTPLVRSAALRLDQTVEIREEAGRIIIQPIEPPSHDLDRMLDAINPDTFPEEDDFAHPRGREAW